MAYYCAECFAKQQEINRLKDRIVHLEGKLTLRQRQATQGPFGSSTPSSKVPIKPSSLPQRQARTGGAKPGHAGHGRRRVEAPAADRVVAASTVAGLDCAAGQTSRPRL